MVHATLQKFGYPDSCLWEDEHWAVLLRPQQVTLAALVLCAKSEATSFGDLPAEAFTAFGDMCKRIEVTLSNFHPFDKINYLALMMVDPHVHFHVLPRYATPQQFADVTFIDAGWPALPDLKQITIISTEQRIAMIAKLRAAASC
jgi:diadenosine tetraphosphate (Ap4A) HIT family hydrolase